MHGFKNNIQYVKSVLVEKFLNKYWWIYGVGSTTYARGEIGVRLSECEKMILIVFVDENVPSLYKNIPRELNGVKIELYETDKIRTLPLLEIDELEELEDLKYCVSINVANRRKYIRPCLPASEIVYGNPAPIRMGEIKPGDTVYSITEDLKIVPKKVVAKWYMGKKPIYKLKAYGFEIKATADHLFLTYNHLTYSFEWKELKDIKPGDLVVVLRYLPRENDSDTYVIDVYGEKIVITRELARLIGAVKVLHPLSKLPPYLSIVPVESIEYVGEEDVYDIEVEDTHTYIANGFIVHNCPGGVSFGCQGITAGTFSCLVFDKVTNEPLALSNNHVCFDKDTEILTLRGWVRFEDLKPNDLVATINPQTLEIEYQKPIAIQKLWYEGKLIRICNEHIDLLVTPDHRLWIRKCWKDGGNDWERYGKVWSPPFKIMYAKDVYEYIKTTGRPLAFKVGGFKFKGLYNNDEIVLNGHSFKIEPFVKFLGWYVDENSNPEYIVRIRNTKHEYLREVYDLLVELGFNPFINDEYDSVIKSGGWVSVNSKLLYEIVSPLGLSKERYVLNFIKLLPSEMAKEFLEYYLKGDGSYERDRWMSCCTVSKKLADDLQILFLHAGLSAKIVEKSGNGYNPYGKYYVLSIRNYNFDVKVYPDEIWLEEYRGYVYDVTVPNGLIIVRRNGKPVVTGNCAMDWGTCRWGKEGLEILQPGPLDIVRGRLGKCRHVGRCPIRLCDEETVSKFLVAKLYRWERVYLPHEVGQPGAGKGKNLIDAAVAKPIDINLFTNYVLELGIPGPVVDVDEKFVGRIVMKSGRTTGITVGKILSTDAVVRVYGWGVCNFVDQIITEVMARPGDSGSYTADGEERWEDGTLRTVGLVYAGSSRITVVCKATHIERMLNVTFSRLTITKKITEAARVGMIKGFTIFDIIK